MASSPVTGSVPFASFNVRALWLLLAPLMLRRPSGPRTTPGMSGSADWKRSVATGADYIICAGMRSTVAAIRPSAEVSAFAVTMRSSRSVSNPSNSATVVISPGFSASTCVADLKPWRSATIEQTLAVDPTSANWNSPWSLEVSVRTELSVPGLSASQVNVSVTPGTTNGWPSAPVTDTVPVTIAGSGSADKLAETNVSDKTSPTRTALVRATAGAAAAGRRASRARPIELQNSNRSFLMSA